MTRSSTSIYDDDFYAWTQEQAAALRDMPQEAVGAHVDIEHVAEEIEDLGKRDLREVTSYLARLLEHLIKIDGSEDSRDVPHWRAEALNFQNAALDAFSPSMRQVIDGDEIWRKMLKRLKLRSKELGEHISAPNTCPLPLDELLADEFDLDCAVDRFKKAPKSRII